MPKFSQSSLDKLETCDPRLKVILNEVINHFDFTILEGHRGQEAQDKAYSEGKSKLKWPEGKHNALPSKAVDITPYPVDFNDTERIVYLAGFVMRIAAGKGIKLRWGGDWNSDTILKDERFRDLGHFEVE